MTPLLSNSPFTFYLFGHQASVESLPQDKAVIFRHPAWEEDEILSLADFLAIFGSCAIDPNSPENKTIGERLLRIQAISQDLHDFYTMNDDDHIRPTFKILAEWQENNSWHIRIQDDFGGSFTYRFNQDGSVFRAYKNDWERVTNFTTHAVASNTSRA